jgi:hypothetical protein
MSGRFGQNEPASDESALDAYFERVRGLQAVPGVGLE